MSDNPNDYKTLYEYERREHTKYIGVFPGADEMREVLTAMRALLAANPDMLLSDALEQAGDNTDEGHTFYCRYDLRKDLAKRLARHAAAINAAGGTATPLATVERALNPPARVPEAA